MGRVSSRRVTRMRIPERGDKVSEVFHALLTGLKVTIHSHIFALTDIFYISLNASLIYLIHLNLRWTGDDNTYTVGDSVLL